MTDAVETMAYTGQVPWHGLGFAVSNNLTAEQMMVAAKLDWTVSKRPVQFVSSVPGAAPITIKDEFALVRDIDQATLSMVGRVYKPVQNAEAFEFFRGFCEAGKMTMETAGSLWGGRYVWCLARVNHDFTIGKKDEVRSYVLLMSPHVHGKALICQYTSVRVVCWNTLNMALGGGLKGDGTGFRMPHTLRFDESTRDMAAHALGLAVDQTAQFKAAAELLAKKKATPAKVEEYFCRVLKYDPKANERKKKGTEQPLEPTKLPKFRDALIKAPGADLDTAKGKWWGALNAITYTIDHELGRSDRSTALKNAWVGHLASVKRDALELALEYAK